MRSLSIGTSLLVVFLCPPSVFLSVSHRSQLHVCTAFSFYQNSCISLGLCPISGSNPPHKHEKPLVKTLCTNQGRQPKQESQSEDCVFMTFFLAANHRQYEQTSLVGPFISVWEEKLCRFVRSTVEADKYDTCFFFFFFKKGSVTSLCP